MTTTTKIKHEAIGGLTAGIVGTVIGYPLDLIKTRMQTARTIRAGMITVGRNVIRTEGFLALYKGMAPPLLSLSLLNTVNFTAYNELRDFYGASRGFDLKNGMAGASAGPLASTVSTVEHFIKTQMQLDNVSSKRYRGSFHCLSSLVQSNGFSILYTGHFVNTAREATFLSSYFYIYEGMREFLIKGECVPPQMAIPLAGGLSGAFAWFISFPLDCIKAGIQGRPVTSSGYIHKSAFLVTTELWKSKGLTGLYSGVTPSIARAFLVSGSRFSAYELAIWLLTGKRYHQ